jgi:hypothetical protein
MRAAVPPCSAQFRYTALVAAATNGPPPPPNLSARLQAVLPQRMSGLTKLLLGPSRGAVLTTSNAHATVAPPLQSQGLRGASNEASAAAGAADAANNATSDSRGRGGDSGNSDAHSSQGTSMGEAAASVQAPAAPADAAITVASPELAAGLYQTELPAGSGSSVSAADGATVPGAFAASCARARGEQLIQQ